MKQGNRAKKRSTLKEESDDESDGQPAKDQSNGNSQKPNDLGLLLTDPKNLKDGNFGQLARDELESLRNMRNGQTSGKEVPEVANDEIENALQELEKQEGNETIELPILPPVQGTISRSISETSFVDINEDKPESVELDNGVDEKDPELLNAKQRNAPKNKPLEDEEENPLKKLRRESSDSQDPNSDFPLMKEEKESDPISVPEDRIRRTNPKIPTGLDANKISDEQRKNIVNVLKGQLTPEQLTRFENSDILKVIENPEFDEESGVEIQYVYVQVVNRNSPCYKKIHGK